MFYHSPATIFGKSLEAPTGLLELPHILMNQAFPLLSISNFLLEYCFLLHEGRSSMSMSRSSSGCELCINFDFPEIGIIAVKLLTALLIDNSTFEASKA